MMTNTDEILDALNANYNGIWIRDDYTTATIYRQRLYCGRNATITVVAGHIIGGRDDLYSRPFPTIAAAAEAVAE